MQLPISPKGGTVSTARVLILSHKVLQVVMLLFSINNMMNAQSGNKVVGTVPSVLFRAAVMSASLRIPEKAILVLVLEINDN